MNETRSEAAAAAIEVELDPLLTALVELASMMERPTSVHALKDGLPLRGGRLTADLMPEAAKRAGLDARWLKRDLEDLDARVLPCLLLLEGGGACLLTGRDSDHRLDVWRPEMQSHVDPTTIEDLERHYQGLCLVVRPDTPRAARTEVAADRRGHWFWREVAFQWPTMLEVLLAALVINCLALASPLFIMNVYDRVVPNQAIETLWALALGVVIAFVFDFLLKSLRAYILDATGRVADIRLSARIFEQILSMRLANRPRNAGAFASNLRDFEALRELLSAATVTAFVDFPFVLLFVAIIWYIGGEVALIPALAVPFVIGVGLAIQWPLKRAIAEASEDAANRHGVLVETLNGLETVKSVGAAGYLQAGFEHYTAATASSHGRVRFLSNLTLNLSGLAANLVTVGVVVFGVYAIGAGTLSVGGLVACTILAGRAMAPLSQIAGLLSKLHQGKTAFRNLDGIMALETDRPAGRRFLHRETIRGRIEFRDVAYTYPGERMPVLNGISLRIEAGERVAIVGRTGSGKSTLARLLTRLYDPDRGMILLDGTEIAQIEPADVRRAVGIVPQDSMLFRGSIRDNIKIAAPDRSDHAVLRAAELAGVQEFAGTDPVGYDLDVGERGQRLAGGQRQAVALARAIVGDPSILILDEPTSAMDNGAEQRLKAKLDDYLEGRTLLLITHRASLLSLVNRLIVLEAGKIVADGPRDQVLEALANRSMKAVQ